MELFDDAEVLGRRGHHATAMGLYEKAARMEREYVESLPSGRPREAAAMRVSVLSLLMRAGRFREVIQLADVYLGEALPDAWRLEIKSLRTEAEEALSGIPQTADPDVVQQLEDLEERLARRDVPLRRISRVGELTADPR